MISRSVMTGFMVMAYLKVQPMVGVLSLPKVEVHQAGSLLIWGETDYCRTRAASSRSEFVIAPFGLSKMTSAAIILLRPLNLPDPVGSFLVGFDPYSLPTRHLRHCIT